MLKLINDIRIFGLDELDNQLHKLNPAEPRFSGMQYRYLAERYAMKLLSLEFETGIGDVFILDLKFTKPHGEVTTEGGSSFRTYDCGLDVSIFAALNTEARHLFFINCIHEMLKATALTSSSGLQKLDMVRDLMILHGENLEVVRVEKHTSSYQLEVCYTVSENAQLILTSKNILANQKKKLVLLELDEYRDAFNLASRISIKQNCAFIYPRNSVLAKSLLKRYWPKLDVQGYHKGNLDYMEVPLSKLQN